MMSNSRWSTRPREIWPAPGTIELICTPFPRPEYVTTSPVSRVTVLPRPAVAGDADGSAKAGVLSAAAGSVPPARAAASAVAQTAVHLVRLILTS
ncbi:hypothetical protein [Streptomyces sp. NPDC006510]|uniref:hypothetical protein n=1 Tax=Streptomyces sp. NPDC006510 TaxID=3155600 RepID=UPI0033B03C6B